MSPPTQPHDTAADDGKHNRASKKWPIYVQLIELLHQYLAELTNLVFQQAYGASYSSTVVQNYLESIILKKRKSEDEKYDKPCNLVALDFGETAYLLISANASCAESSNDYSSHHCIHCY